VLVDALAAVHEQSGPPFCTVEPPAGMAGNDETQFLTVLSHPSQGISQNRMPTPEVIMSWKTCLYKWVLAREGHLTA
jgi:hypothetical protein